MIGAINFCQKSDVLKAVLIIKTIMQIIFIVVPAIIVIVSIISLVKNLLNGEETTIEIIKPIITKLVIGIIIFLIPPLFKMIITTGSNNEEFMNKTYLSCLNNATKEKIDYYANIEKQEKEKKKKEEKMKEQAKKRKANNKPNDLSATYFIGDSRTVGMYNTIYNAGYSSDISITNGNEYWLGATGLGLNWFLNTAIPNIEPKLSKGNANVIIQLGTNDLYNDNAAVTYVSAISNLASKYPKSNFIIVSVNPIEDNVAANHGYTVRNNQVISFNNKYKSAINSSSANNIKYCDVYSMLANKSQITRDGIHYTADTYKTIYNAINSCK